MLLMPALLHEDLLHRLARARERARDEFAEATLDAAALAREACLSEKQFRRVFAQLYGVTPGRFLTQLRMDRAQELLARGCSVTDAGLRVGYSSLGSFSSRFSQETGRSPRCFQQELRALGNVPARLEALYVPMCFISPTPL